MGRCLTALVPERRGSAPPQQMTCLLRLGRHGDVKTLCDATDAPVEILMAAGKFYDEQKQWAAALPLHERIAALSAEYRSVARGRQVTCLLNLARDDEARAVYEAPDAPREARIAAADFFATSAQREML
jgi:hypothetical protein